MSKSLIASVCLACALLCACSTTRSLAEGQLRLASNEITTGSEEVKSSALSPYLRQQVSSSLLFGWDPLLNIYNWSDDPKSLWRRIGTPPVVFNEGLMHSSADNIAKRLEYLGYYHSSVTPRLSTKGKIAKVRYDVHLGKTIQIDSIHFELPDGPIREDFLSDSSNLSIRPGSLLSEAALEAESVRSAAVMREKGYYDFNKNHYFFEADTLGSTKILHYRIKGYTRNESELSDGPISKYRFRKVSIHHGKNLRLRESTLRKLNTITPGSLYSESIVNTSYYRLSALNLFNSVSIELNPADSAALDCDIRLSSSDLYGFKLNAEVSSNSSGLLGASPQLSFYHKNVFGGGERLSASLSGNWQFIPGSNVSSSEFAASSSLSFPLLAGRSAKLTRYIPRTELSASYNYQNRPEYTRSIAGFSYGFSGQIGQEFFYQVHPVQLDYVKLSSLSSDFSETLIANPYLWDSFMDQIDLGLGLTLYHTTDAAIVPKTAYRFSRLSVNLSGNFISLFDRYLPYDETYGEHQVFGLPYNQYVRAEFSAGKVFRFGSNASSALALRLNAGIGKAYGNSSALPFEKQFYCGGASSMRGWQVRTLGPGSSPLDDLFAIPSQTGDLKIEADAELRFPLVWKLEGALFAEAGNIWMLSELKGESMIKTIAADWGLGLRLNLDFILLRIDAGLRLHDPARPEGSRWLRVKDWFSANGAAVHFGVGYPF